MAGAPHGALYHRRRRTRGGPCLGKVSTWRPRRGHLPEPGSGVRRRQVLACGIFARLAQDLVDQRGSRVLVLCGPNERPIARQIVRLAARAAVCTVAEEALSIGLTKALIRRADLLVTTDSGPRHFAAAFERPVVTLFGPTHISWTETYYSKAINLQMKVPCGPCQKRVCPLDHRCMTELLPQDVFAAVNDLMSRSERGQPLPLVVTRSERKAS